MRFLLVATFLLPSLSMRAEIIADAKNHAVTFSAISTDCGLDVQLEFLFVGPNSDRDYEAMFVLEDSVKELAEAFSTAGISGGHAIDPLAARFWPVGTKLKMEPSFNSLVREMRGEKTPAILYTGGSRDEKGFLHALTNMPAAVFALYGCSQSLLQLNDVLQQSDAYGRFQPAVKIPKGTRRNFTFSLSEEKSWEPFELKIDVKTFSESILKMKEKAKDKELHVTTSFSPHMKVKEAKACAEALAIMDSVQVKINGFADGDFFYRAFLPLEKWRNRKDRLAQPPELHVSENGDCKIIEVKEDWSDSDSLDPKLSSVEYKCKDAKHAAKIISSLAKRTSSVLIFATENTPLEKLHAIKKHVEIAIMNWYVFPVNDNEASSKQK